MPWDRMLLIGGQHAIYIAYTEDESAGQFQVTGHKGTEKHPLPIADNHVPEGEWLSTSGASDTQGECG